MFRTYARFRRCSSVTSVCDCGLPARTAQCGRVSNSLMRTGAAEFGKNLLTTDEVAEFLGVSPRTIEDWRRRGGGPRFIRLRGRAVRYRPSELARWLAEHEVASTCAAALK